MSKIITNEIGVPIGRLTTQGSKTVVTDWCGRILGTSDDTGTYDSVGKMISRSNAPELLLR